jgi:hypothetical protein
MSGFLMSLLVGAVRSRCLEFCHRESREGDAPEDGDLLVSVRRAGRPAQFQRRRCAMLLLAAAGLILATRLPAEAGSPVTIGFDLGFNGMSFTTYTQSGFAVSSTEGNWQVHSYGNPRNSVQFESAAGTTNNATIQVKFAGSAFMFKSVDLYSSTTSIPFVFTGLRNSSTVFTVGGTQPNTFGNFATVANSHATDLIDTLLITLTNTAFPCCPNPMGLDNIAVTSAEAGPSATIGFGGLSTHGSALAAYTESGFTVSPTQGSWTVNRVYGNPLPFIQFLSPPATTTTATIQVTFVGTAFMFKWVDLYSSITTIPFIFTGLRNSITVFSVGGTQPNTLGNFANVANSHGSDIIDTLLITLSNTNPSSAGSNPMGLDNIALAPLFTDDPLIAGVSSIKAVHVSELRAGIESARTARGLGAYSWSDPTFSAGSTVVKAAHILDLRNALAEVYVAASLTQPTYVDATLTIGLTPLRAVHIAELRSALLAVE